MLQQVQGQAAFGTSFADQIVEVVADGINRTATIEYFPGFDLVSPFRMDLVCGKIIVLPNDVGLSCDGATNIGWTNGTPASDFDQNFEDDDVIEVNVEDFNPDGGCGVGSAQIVLRFTKQ